MKTFTIAKYAMYCGIVASCYGLSGFVLAAQTVSPQPKPAPAAPAAPAPAPLPVGADPEMTTAVYGDWIMRCQSSAQQKRACEVATVITPQGQTAPVAQLVITKVTPTQSRKIAMLLPANIQFATHPKLVMAKPGAGEVELNWLSCNPGACLATASLADDMLATLSAQTDPGRAVFHDSTDREIAIVISFRGLAQASVALAKD